MIIRNIVLASVAALTLVACDKNDCTEAVATEKLTALTAKIQEVGATDPAKLTELMGKLTELQSTATTNPEEVCKLVDDMMATLQ